MSDESVVLIITPEEGVPIERVLDALRRLGVGEVQNLSEVGLIIATAPASLLDTLRALPEIRTVDVDRPVHIASGSAE